MLKILYEDDYLLVINKPALIHSISNNASNTEDDELTLSGLIKDYLKSNSFMNNDKEAGLIQRLDFSSSGVIIAAKNKDVFLKLKEQIKKQEIYKLYYIIVENLFIEKELIINNFIGQEYRRSKKVKVYEKEKPRSLSAKTQFNLIAKKDNVSLLKALVFKGRRHQIRAHSSFLNHPLVGDILYSSRFNFFNKFNIKRDFFLHCGIVKFNHPEDNTVIEIEAKVSNTESALIKDIFGVEL